MSPAILFFVVTSTLIIKALIVYCVSSLDEVFRGHTGYDLISQASTEISLPDKTLCSHFCLSILRNCTGFIYTNHICYLYDEFCVKQQLNATDVAFVKTSADVCTYMETLSSTLALNKPASTSSPRTDKPAERANDGEIPPSSGVEDDYTFSSNRELTPWWRVDMLEVYTVTAIYFMNRGYNQYWSELMTWTEKPTKLDLNDKFLTCVWDHAKNMAGTVSVLETDIFSSSSRCGYNDGVVEQFDNWINCTQPMRGQFAQLQMLRSGVDNFYFQLYEVEVHGIDISDVCCWQDTV